MFPHIHTHTLWELITPTTFHCAIHLNQLSHQRQYILPSISLSLSKGVIEGCKEEDVSAHRLLPQSAPSPHTRLPLTRTALKCLWVFMFVVFYRSGQEPGAVKVWIGGGGEGMGGRGEGGWVESYCKSNLYWEQPKRQTACARPPCNALFTWSIQGGKVGRRQGRKEESEAASFRPLLTASAGHTTDKF